MTIIQVKKRQTFSVELLQFPYFKYQFMVSVTDTSTLERALALIPNTITCIGESVIHRYEADITMLAGDLLQVKSMQFTYTPYLVS